MTGVLPRAGYVKLYIMNRLLFVVRSTANKIVELSRGVNRELKTMGIVMLRARLERSG